MEGGMNVKGRGEKEKCRVGCAVTEASSKVQHGDRRFYTVVAERVIHCDTVAAIIIPSDSMETVNVEHGHK
jgi:hypothetical protein